MKRISVFLFAIVLVLGVIGTANAIPIYSRYYSVPMGWSLD